MTPCVTPRRDPSTSSAKMEEVTSGEREEVRVLGKIEGGEGEGEEEGKREERGSEKIFLMFFFSSSQRMLPCALSFSIKSPRQLP